MASALLLDGVKYLGKLWPRRLKRSSWPRVAWTTDWLALRRARSYVAQLTIMIPLVGEVRAITQGTGPESTPESAALHSFLESRNINVLCKPAILKLLRKIAARLVVNVILVLTSDEDHQIIMTVLRRLVAVLMQPVDKANQ